MKRSALYAGIVAMLFSFSAGVFAAEEAVATPKKPAVAAKKNDKLAEKKKALAKIKKIDINSASKEELVKLPNVSEADADKIIAGRPYGSKVWLKTRNILPEGTYEPLKAMIFAKQPYADAADNAALYGPKAAPKK